jgi:hypothetical protein
VPDTVAVIIWVIAGVAGGNAAGEHYDLGPGNTIAGAIGGVIGAFILQTAIPALSGIDFGPILGQAIWRLLTVIAAVKRRQRRR